MKALALPLRRPVGTAAVYTTLLVFGLYAAQDLPLALAPDVSLPSLSVQLVWPQATPEEMEALVTSRVESEAGRLPGVREMSSVSGTGWAQVDLGFGRDARMDRAEVFLRERLAALRSTLPPGLAAPTIESFQSDESEGGRFLVLRVGGPYTAESLRQVLEDRILPRLTAVPGVAAARVYGGGERELRTDLDPAALARGTTAAAAVASTLEQVGGTRSVGVERRAGQRIAAVLAQPDAAPASLASRRVGGAPAAPVQLADVADIHAGWSEPRRLARVNGVPAVQLVVEREPGTNVLRVARVAMQALDNARSLLPSGVEMDVLLDQSECIRDELGALGKRVAISVAAVFLVLLISLRNVRAPIAVLIAVGFSTMLTFLLFRAAGIGINLVTLSGLALAFGMAVDATIVLLQNIARRARRVVPGFPAAAGLPIPGVLAAVRDVLLPLGAGTLTTAVVMVPLLYVSGDLRTYYLPFVFAVCLSLAASFAVAVTLVPSLARWALASQYHRTASQRMPFLERTYAPLLDRALRRPWLPILVALVLFSGGLYVFLEKVSRGSLLSGEADTSLRVSVALPPGSGVERTNELASNFERIALEHPFYARRWIDRVQVFVWDNRGFVEVRFDPGVAMTTVPESVKLELTALAAALSGAEISVMGHGPGFSSSRSRSSPSFQFTLRGPDYATLTALADDLGRRLRREPRVREVNTNASGWFADDAVDLALIPDRSRLARLGLTMSDFVAAVQPAVASELAGRTLRTPEGDVEARVRLAGDDVMSSEQFRRTLARTPAGITYPLSDVLDIVERPTPSEIRRTKQQYERAVTFDFRSPRPVANRFVRAFLSGTTLPPGYSLEDGLNLFLTRREQQDVRLALSLALGLVFMVAAALFESLRLPFVAMLALPLGFTGIAAAFWALDEPFDRAAYVGLIMLAGVAVNGALLLVHRAGALGRRGLAPRAAIRRAALERCRPLVLTMATSTAGLLPLAIGGDAGAADTWRALALAAASGLFASTLVALGVVPALFVVVARRSGRAPRVPSPALSEVMPS